MITSDSSDLTVKILCIKFQPDKRFCRTSGSQETQPILQVMPCDHEEKKDDANDGSDHGDSHTDDQDSHEDNHLQSGGDTDIVDNSYRELTAVILSAKSAKVLLLAYSYQCKQ